MLVNDRKIEIGVWAVHLINRTLYGFERMDELNHDKNIKLGEPKRIFYPDGVYSYLSSMFLLDKGNEPMGGTFYKEFKKVGMENCLSSIQELLNISIGSKNFGDAILAYRNKSLVHGTLSDKDVLKTGEEFDGNKFTSCLSEMTKKLFDLRDDICKQTGLSADVIFTFDLDG